MKVDYFLRGYITTVTYALQLTCSGAGYVRDQRSVGMNALPTDQSVQSVRLENDITIHKRSRGGRSADHERVSEEEERIHRATNLFKVI